MLVFKVDGLKDAVFSGFRWIFALSLVLGRSVFAAVLELSILFADEFCIFI